MSYTTVRKKEGAHELSSQHLLTNNATSKRPKPCYYVCINLWPKSVGKSPSAQPVSSPTLPATNQSAIPSTIPFAERLKPCVCCIWCCSTVKVPLHLVFLRAVRGSTHVVTTYCYHMVVPPSCTAISTSSSRRARWALPLTLNGRSLTQSQVSGAGVLWGLGFRG